jgi:hypothetical protein
MLSINRKTKTSNSMPSNNRNIPAPIVPETARAVAEAASAARFRGTRFL